MHQRLIRTALTLAMVAATAIPVSGPFTWGQTPDWMPTVGTHAWSRFGPRAWKEVRVRTYAAGKNGELMRPSTTIARTRVMNIGAHSFSLCVSSTVEVAGREFSSEPQVFSRDVAPDVQSSRVVGEQQVTIDGQAYTTQVIAFTSTTDAQTETNTIFFCRDTTPQMLKRVTTTVDSANPDMATETTASVTELNKMADILGEPKCTWASTTVKKMRDKTITIREVNCADVPGELVSQVTEEHDANGVLVARKELELVGYGYGRQRLFRRHR